jgi:hypothetical protein
MKPYKTARMIATLFLGVLFGLYKHFDEMGWLQRGRDAFMAYQSEHFQRIVAYHSTGTMLIAGIILAAIAVGLYELVAAGIAHVLPPSAAEE